MIKGTPFLHKLVSGVRNAAYKQRSLVPLSLTVSFEAILDALPLQGQKEFYFSSANYFQIKASVEIRSTSFVCIGTLLLGLEKYHGSSGVILPTLTGSNISAPDFNQGFLTPTALHGWTGSRSGQHSWKAGPQCLLCTECCCASLSMVLWFVVVRGPVTHKWLQTSLPIFLWEGI